MTPRARKRARLVLRDVSAAAAFLTVALPGSVPLWALAGFGLGFLASIFDKRLLSGRTVWSVVLLLGIAVALFGAVWRGGLDLVVAACAFAALVTAHRMVSDTSLATDRQVLLTSLLMLSGGAALSGEIWFGACLALFAISSSLSLGLGVLEGPTENDEELPVEPGLKRLGVGVTFALVGALAFFVFFPRLSWNLAGRRTGPGLGGAATTGMSDRVRLGGGGDIKTSPRVVARVKLSPDPNQRRLEQYWPGRVFDRFDGKEWRGGGQERQPRGRVVIDQLGRGAITQQIELLPGYDSRTLIALDRPVAFSDARLSNSNGTQRVSLVEVTGEEVHFFERGNAYTYTATSLPPGGRPNLEEGPAPEPFEVDPRVKALAEQVVGSETDSLAAGRKLEAWLKSNLSYTLELPGDVADPLTDFLFVRKQGHCEHFATALAMLLRTRGHNARVVAGFYGGERIGESYVVRAGDAHAWTEVFHPERGWTALDATPESGRSSQPLALLSWLADRYEELEDLWRQRVVDYSFQDQVDLARSLVKPPRSASNESAATSSLPPKEAFAAALCFSVLVFVVVRMTGRSKRDAKHPAASFLGQIEQRLGKAGIARLPGEPLEELSSRLSDSSHPLAPAIAKATHAYLGARFGGRALTSAQKAALLSALTQ